MAARLSFKRAEIIPSEHRLRLLKVLHVIPTIDPMYGGPVAAIVGMTAAQAKTGVEVRLLTTDDQTAVVPQKIACETKIFHSKFGAWQWSPELGAALPEQVKWADIVNIHTLWTYPVAVAARACSAAGVPYILRPAGMLDHWSLAQKRLKKKMYTWLIESRTINKASALWFTSEEERANAGLYKDRNRDFVLPLGVGLDQYFSLPAKGVFRRAFLNSDGRRIVLFLGRLASKKQPDVVLRAFASVVKDFDDTILVMAGPDDRGSLADLEKLATDLRIYDRVYFTGALQKDEVVAALNDAEVFALPSLHENFGVAVIEAMATGTPVIVAERVALAHVVKQSEAGIVIDATHEELGSSLRYLLGHPTVGVEMGKRGRQVALDKFTWERIVPSLTDHYLQIISASDNG